MYLFDYSMLLVFQDLCQIAERRWVANLLRSGAASSITPGDVESVGSGDAETVAISPPTLEFYLAAAEQKQAQQS